MKPGSKDFMRYRRDCLDAWIACIESGEPVTGVGRVFALRILEQLREGYDVREDVGVIPKLGAPSSKRGPQKWMAAHYLKLREQDPDTLAKVHAAIVAEAWGYSAANVMNVAARHRSSVASLLPVTTLEQIEQIAAILARYGGHHGKDH